MVSKHKFSAAVVLVVEYLCSAAGPVRKQQFSGSVAANGAVKISSGLDDSTSKVSPSLVRRAKETHDIEFDTHVNVDIRISRKHDFVVSVDANANSNFVSEQEEAKAATKTAAEVDAEGKIVAPNSMVRYARVRQDLPRGSLKARDVSAEHIEDPRSFPTFRLPSSHISSSTRSNLTLAQSTHMKNVQRSTIEIGFRPWLGTDALPSMSSSRFGSFAVLRIFLTSYPWTVVLFIIFLICQLAIIVVMFTDHVRNRLLETMQTFGGLQGRTSDSVSSDDSDNSSEVWDGEGQDWEGFLWKLNSDVKAEERANWKNWRTRFFNLKVSILSAEEDKEVVGIHLEFTSEKGNMAGVGFWVSQKSQAVVRRLEPIRMATLSSNEEENILAKANMYQIAIDVDLPPRTELPRKLYPLSITLQETEKNLVVASPDGRLIRELASRIELHSKVPDQDLFEDPSKYCIHKSYFSSGTSSEEFKF